MNQAHNWFPKLLVCSFLVLASTPAQAQITPDNTLGAEGSTIAPNVLINGASSDLINGGAIRGSNLFHSFSQFNINNGQRVYFGNPSGIENILTRVTGGNASNIFGTLGVNGAANLFLLNPNGILFGQNARLDMRGSFVGTTASSVKFADGREFSATAPQNAPLLTISVPLGLQFGVNSGKIIVQGDGTGLRSTVDLIDINSGLRVPSNQTLALVGGDINLEGATIKTAGGRIELGSVSGEGLVSLSPTNKGFLLGYGGVQNFGNTQLTQQASVDASGAGAGDVQVTGKRVTLSDGSAIEASTLGANNGGELIVNATESVELNNTFSTLAAQVYPGATGNGGNLRITTKDLVVRDGAFISTSTSGAGKGGNLTVNASNSVQVIGTSDDGRFRSNFGTSANQGLTGDAGDLTITTKDLVVRDGASISAGTYGKGNGGNLTVNASGSVQFIGSGLDSSAQPGATGNAGNITVKAQAINLSNQAFIGSSNSGQGRGGKITLKADDTISLSDGSTIASSSFASVFGGVNSESSGDIEIRARKLSIDGGANTFISSTNLDDGKAGNIQIIADDLISLNGSPFISSSTTGQGDGGNIELQTRSLTLANGGSILTQASGRGSSGDLLVNASDSVTLSGIATLINPQTGESFTTVSRLTTTALGTGNSGQLTINTQRLSINSGYITTNASSLNQLGRGGNLTINAKDSVEIVGSLTNDLSTIATNSFQSGDAGNLIINTDRLSIRDGAQVTTSTLGTGKGGNLTIDAKDSVEVLGSSPKFPSTLSTSGLRSGDAGSMTINTGRLNIRDGAQVNTITGGTGKGGNLTIDAKDLVEVTGASFNRRSVLATASTLGSGDAGSMTINTGRLNIRDQARVSTETFGAGKGGNLTIKAQDVLVQDGAQVSTGTFGQGSGGNLIVNANGSVQLIGTSANGNFPSGLFASAEVGSTGNAGELTVNTPQLLVRDGARVSVTNTGTGNAGIMTINSDRIRLDNKASLNANTRSPNQDPNREQATINLNTQNLILRRNSNITTNATGKDAIGGNINIDTDFLIALENSDINANSTDSRGGRVRIAAQGIYSTQSRNALTPESDITATGASPDLSGTTDINTPDVDPTQGLIKLPEERIDTSNQLGQICPRGRYPKKPLGEFVVSGRGSLPPSPLQSITGTPNLIPLASLEGETATGRRGDAKRWRDGEITPVINNGSSAIIEAQGFARTPEGKIIIVAYAPQATPSSRPTAAACPVSK